MRRTWAVAAALMLWGALGAATAEPAQAQNRFWLVNESGRTIVTAYVSPSRLDQWGPDVLGTSVISAGQQVWVTPNFTDCQLDVRVVYQDGGDEQRMGVNACGLSRIVFGGGASAGGPGATVSGGPGATVTPGPTAGSTAVVANPSFNFVNAAGRPIRELYVSLTTDSNWGPDRLGPNTLAAGSRIPLSLPANVTCTVDMRVVYMDGSAQERRSVDTCNVVDYDWR